MLGDDTRISGKIKKILKKNAQENLWRGSKLTNLTGQFATTRKSITHLTMEHCTLYQSPEVDVVRPIPTEDCRKNAKRSNNCIL